MTELPPGWAETRLGDLGQYINGRGFKSTEWTAHGRPIIRIQNLTKTSSSFNYFDGDVDARYIVKRGDLLISWAATLGAHFWQGPEGVLNQHIFRVESHIHQRFHKYLVDYALGDLQSKTHGSGMVHITRGPFDDTPVLLPPLAEQERIVAAIEEQFSRLDAGVAALERVRLNLKRMRAAVLQAAITGRLLPNDPCDSSLHPMLGDRKLLEPPFPGQPANWCTVTIGSIAQVTSGATPSRGRKDYWEDGSIPWVTSTLLNRDRIAQVREYVTSRALRETSIKLMPPGTLLVAMYGEGQTRGRCSELLIEATTNQACASIVLHDELQFARPYLKMALTASYEANRRLSAGGVQPNLSVGIIKNLLVALPPVNEQVRICGEASRQLALIAHLGHQLEVHRRHSDGLRSSILAAAFSGKLVPQDPTDEPASVLLERIAAERTSSNGHKAVPKPRQERLAV